MLYLVNSAMKEGMRHILVAASIMALIMLLGCAKKVEKEDMTKVTGSSIQELKATACNTADDAHTCDTRLPELGFVTKEDCCELFKKCC